MTHTRRTFTLTRKWDLTLDGSGNIGLTHNAAATAQNVANEARLFTNDAYFIQDQGTPYFVTSLGQRTNEALARSYLRRAALRVFDVREVLGVEVETDDIETRVLKGDIRFTTKKDSEDVTVAIDI